MISFVSNKISNTDYKISNVFICLRYRVKSIVLH